MTKIDHQDGISVIELLLVVAILGLLCGFVITQSNAAFGGLKGGSDELITIVKLARTQAVSTTTPHRVVALSDSVLAIEYGGPCDDAGATWTQVEDGQLTLPTGVRLDSTSWEVCFKTRGWTTDVHQLRLTEGNSYQDVSVLLGGAVRPGPVHRRR